jgi:hypothetical protein
MFKGVKSLFYITYRSNWLRLGVATEKAAQGDLERALSERVRTAPVAARVGQTNVPYIRFAQTRN